MYEKELFDETLDINSTNNYEISIQLSLNGFSFCLYDSLRNKFVMLREYKLSGHENNICKEVEEIIYKDDFLAKPYHAYRLIFVFERNTLVPAGLFDPAVKDDYFSLNHKLEEGYIIANNKIEKPDALLLFDIRSDVRELLIKAFPEASLSHHIKPLLFSAYQNADSYTGKYIQLNIEDTFFNLFLIEDRKLVFFNTFRYRSSSDILYYILNTFEQFTIGKDEEINVSGLIEKDDELYNNMSRYISKINFVKPRGSWSVSYTFDSINLHSYSNLLNIISCV